MAVEGTDDVRAQLVEQLRARGIEDAAVLEVMGDVPRERFLPAHLRASAYADRPLPIGHDATISQPYVVALMLELAEIRSDDRVLDVGTGSGYAAALAARLAAEVVSVEVVPELAERARGVLEGLGDRVRVVVGDGRRGWVGLAPYDVILVAAAPRRVPRALVDQLADGGRLVLPVGPPHGTQDLVVVRRDGDRTHRESHGSVRFVPLVRARGLEPPQGVNPTGT